jgi:tetratricopeptide (TPR) repeat protein
MLPDLPQGLSATRRRALNALDEVLDEFPSKTQDVGGLIARGDAYLQVGKRAEALTNYEKALEFASAGEQRRRVGQRVTLGLLYNGRLAEAEQTALKLIRKQEANATTFALLGAVQFQQRKYQQARDAVEAGVKARNPASLTVATFCDLVLGAKAQAYKEAKDAVLAADMAETQFVAQALLADVGDKEGAYKSFYRAALNAPLYMPVLVERAYEIMAYDAQDGERFSKALNLFDLVLALEPDNADATAGRAIALMQEKRHTAAQAAITRLGKLEPTAPDYFVLAAADLARDAAKIRMVNDALARARQIDPLNFKDAKVPDLPELTARIMRLRRTIPMTPRFLDRADQPPAPLDDAKVAQAAP